MKKKGVAQFLVERERGCAISNEFFVVWFSFKCLGKIIAQTITLYTIITNESSFSTNIRNDKLQPLSCYTHLIRINNSTVQYSATKLRHETLMVEHKSRSKLKPGGTCYAIFTFTPLATIHFPMPSSFVMSFVRLNCKVLCHGNRVRVTGSFLRRSCIEFIRIRGLRNYLDDKRRNKRMSTDHKTY